MAKTTTTPRKNKQGANYPKPKLSRLLKGGQTKRCNSVKKNSTLLKCNPSFITYNKKLTQCSKSNKYSNFTKIDRSLLF